MGEKGDGEAGRTDDTLGAESFQPAGGWRALPKPGLLWQQARRWMYRAGGKDRQVRAA